MKKKLVIKDKSDLIIVNPTYKGSDKHIQLLRIIITDQEMKIDFGYKADDYYYRGGWITISPETFIRPTGSNEKYFLINATNIPYGPEKLHFNSTLEWRYFSLYFPLVPEGTKTIDLIEKETEKIDPTQFNFYTISLNEVSKQYKIALPEL